MACEQTSLLKNLAVHEPDALDTEPWQAHVNECPACRATWEVLATSLAVYCRIAEEDAARLSVRPSWETFVRRLQEQRAARRRATAMTGPWLVGVVGLFMVGGIFSWGLWSDTGDPIRSPLALQEGALSISIQEKRSDQTSRSGDPLTRFAAATSGYGMALSGWREFRRVTRLLEPHSLATGRPSGEVVILPFGHDRVAIPYVMPVTSAPASSGAHLEYPVGYSPAPAFR